MDEYLVPTPDNLPETNVVDYGLLKERFSVNRQSALSGLACLPGIPMIASSLKNDALYKVVLSPGAGHLKKGTHGFYQAVVRNRDGTIVEHAKLEKVILNPDLATSLISCGMQVQLAMIAAQLADIEKGIEDIKDYLHNDRVSKIVAGVNQFEQAIRLQNEEHKSGLMEHSIAMLNTGVSSVIKSLDTEIEEIPRPWLVVNIFGRELGNKKTRKKMATATESFASTLFGIQAITECYALWGEGEASAFTLISLMEDLQGTELETASRISRRLPPEINHWQVFLDQAPRILSEANSIRRIHEAPCEFNIDCKAKELCA